MNTLANPKDSNSGLSNSNPLVSILITTYNALPHINDTIEALINQDYKNIQIVIIDDGSQDETCKCIKSWALKNKSIKFYLPGRLGRGRALNYGLKKCDGEYIAINDADDISKPNRISKQLEFLLQNPEYGMIGSNFDILHLPEGGKTYSNNPFSDTEIRQTLTKMQAFQHSTVVIKKSVLDQIGGYSEKIPFLFDREIFIRIAKITKVANLPDRLVIIKRHRNQYFNHGFSAFKRNWMHHKMCMKAIWVLGFPKYQILNTMARLCKSFAAVFYYQLFSKPEINRD